jgi:all-trans-8'-apo-beta-carotenal 15,15'-oxygenase
MILDGDGMVQAFEFGGGRLRYRNRFVRTRKFVDEQKAGRFQYATWASHAPGGILANIGKSVENQAGVTVMRWNRSLYAFDEAKLPYQMDPETLETVGLSDLGDKERKTGYHAHWKRDGHNGDLLLFGMGFGRRTTIEITILDKEGGLKRHFKVDVPRRVYIHDWLATERHLVFVLHPGLLPLSGLIRWMLGLTRPASIIEWKPEMGNLIVIVDRAGADRPLFFEAEAAWMWHGLNAYEEDGRLVVDFCGAAHAIGIGGDDSPFFTIMEGRDTFVPEGPQGGPLLRRYTIDLSARILRQEIICAEGFYDFPFVNQGLACHRHRYGYLAVLGERIWFPTRVARIDTLSGKAESYCFGEGCYCTEPVFVPEPGHEYRPESAEEPGWLVSLVYRDATKKSDLAILRADRIQDGPVSLVHLRHHVPLSFHGFWHPMA